MLTCDWAKGLLVNEIKLYVTVVPKVTENSSVHNLMHTIMQSMEQPILAIGTGKQIAATPKGVRSAFTAVPWIHVASCPHWGPLLSF